MRPVLTLCRLHDLLSDAGYVIGTLGLGSMAAIYCWEVLTRYFLGVATDWANDTFSNLLCVTVFSMVPHATRRAGTPGARVRRVVASGSSRAPPITTRRGTA